jgi:uncharacterized protein (TIGR03435 family)
MNSNAHVAGTIALIVTSGIAIQLTLHAQSPGDKLAFEVTSVKPVNDVRTVGGGGFQPGGRYVVTNLSVRVLIRSAYRIQDMQIVGGPDWLGADRFDIQAKTASDPSQDQRGELLRELLANRFKLVAHHETRELPVYALVVARSDGRLGPQLKRAATPDCGSRGAVPPSPPGAPPSAAPCGALKFGPGSFVARTAAIEQLAASLSNIPVLTGLDRIVVDRSGLTGTFDFDLQWAPLPFPGSQASPAGANDGPSIFTALQEQLGLKLDSQRAPVDVLVIDSVERPTPD